MVRPPAYENASVSAKKRPHHLESTAISETPATLGAPYTVFETGRHPDAPAFARLPASNFRYLGRAADHAFQGGPHTRPFQGVPLGAFWADRSHRSMAEVMAAEANTLDGSL